MRLVSEMCYEFCSNSHSCSSNGVVVLEVVGVVMELPVVLVLVLLVMLEMAVKCH